MPHSFSEQHGSIAANGSADTRVCRVPTHRDTFFSTSKRLDMSVETARKSACATKPRKTMWHWAVSPVRSFSSTFAGRRPIPTGMNFRRIRPEIRCLSPVCPARHRPARKLTSELNCFSRLLNGLPQETLSRASPVYQVSSLRYDHLVAVPPSNPVARTREQPRAAATAEDCASDHHFNLASGYGQWNPQFGANGKALPESVSDVCLCLHFRLPLADTARNGRALSDKHAVLVLMDIHNQLHCTFILSQPAKRLTLHQATLQILGRSAQNQEQAGRAVTLLVNGLSSAIRPQR